MKDEQRTMNLEEIKARAAKATKGPWVIKEGRSCQHVLSEDNQFSTGCINFDGRSTWTAEFIAHAREDVPALVAEVERLQQQAEAQARALEALRAAAQVVIEQVELDAATRSPYGLGATFDFYEASLTGEQVEALRAALRQAEEEGA